MRYLQKRWNLLKQQGAEIIEIEYLDNINKLGDAEFDLMQFEFKDGLNKYLAATHAHVKHWLKLLHLITE